VFGGVLFMVSILSFWDKNSFKKSCKSLALTAVLSASLCLTIIPNSANAVTVGPGCDPVFMEAMQKKAWMEAQREIMIAQATIAKPDSVFALGCFDSMTSGFSVGFSGGNDFTSNMNSNISNFISSAFNHSLGGGHYPGGGNNSNLSNCSAMADLWKEARCANLDLPSKLLNTLQDIAGYDRGSFPATCPAPTGFGSTGSAATPLGTFYGAKVAGKSVGALFDDMNLFAKVVAPRSQLTAPGQCSAGIPTGVSINVSGSARPEIICPNPGCVSNGNATPKCCDYSGGNCSP